MPENAPSPATVLEEVLQRLNDWKGLWTWSAGYHYLFGVSGVAASSLAVLEFSDECRWIPKVLAAIAAICLAVLVSCSQIVATRNSFEPGVPSILSFCDTDTAGDT